MLQQGLGIQFDLACRRSETSGDGVLLLSELAVACLERYAHPARVLAQRPERNTGWVESRAVSSLDITVPEVGTQTKTARQVEDDLGIGTSLLTRLDHPWPQLHQRLRLGTPLEANLERLALEGAGNREHDVGQLGSWVHEQVGMDIEVERCQGLAPSLAVSVGHEQVGAESDQSSHRVGPLLQDRPVELVRSDKLPAGWAQRPLQQAKCARTLLCRQQRCADDIPTWHGWEQHIASRAVEASGQHVELGNRAGDLSGIRLHLDATPGVVGDGPRFPEHPGRAFYLVALDATDRLYSLWDITPAEVGHEVEGGSTHDPALHRLKRERTGKGRLWMVSFIAASGRIIGDRTVHRLAPGHIPVGAALSIKIALGQQTAAVRAHQQWAVRPVTDEVAIIPAALDHDMGNAERQRAVGTRSHSQPEIRLVRGPSAAGVDNNQTRSSFERRRGGNSVGEPGNIRVVAPKQDAAGMLEVRHIATGNSSAEGILRGQKPSPPAQFHRRAQVRTTERIHQALNPDY